MSRRDALRLGGLAGSALAVPALLAGCGTGSGRIGNVLRVAQDEDTTTLDPHMQGDMVSMNILINMFDTLTTRDAANRLAPCLALSWVAKGDLTWRFRLRPNVTFQNGEPCDAAAVKYSIERVIDPETASPIVELRYVEKAEVVDPLTVDLHTSQHDPILPAKLSLFGGVIVPPRYLKRVGPDAFAKAPIGTGPFRFASWQRDHELRMRANPTHWNGRPRLAELIFRPVPNPASSLAALQSNEVDLVAGLTPDAAQQLAGFPGVVIDSSPGIRTSYLSLDTADPQLRDARVRRALNHAMDVPQLIKAVLDGKASTVPAMIPDGVFGFDKTVEPFARDVGLARRLLADAGHPDGIDTALAASNDDAILAEAMSGLLARAGIRARVKLYDPGTYTDLRTSENRRALGPMYLSVSTVWTMDGSSMLQSIVRSDRRQSRWTSTEADRLIDAEELSADPGDRLRAFSEMQRLIKREAPFVPLFQQDNIYARNRRPRWKSGVIGSLRMASAEVVDA